MGIARFLLFLVCGKIGDGLPHHLDFIRTIPKVSEKPWPRYEHGNLFIENGEFSYCLWRNENRRHLPIITMGHNEDSYDNAPDVFNTFYFDCDSLEYVHCRAHYLTLPSNDKDILKFDMYYVDSAEHKLHRQQLEIYDFTLFTFFLNFKLDGAIIRIPKQPPHETRLGLYFNHLKLPLNDPPTTFYIYVYKNQFMLDQGGIYRLIPTYKFGASVLANPEFIYVTKRHGAYRCGLLENPAIRKDEFVGLCCEEKLRQFDIVGAQKEITKYQHERGPFYEKNWDSEDGAMLYAPSTLFVPGVLLPYVTDNLKTDVKRTHKHLPYRSSVLEGNSNISQRSSTHGSNRNRSQNSRSVRSVERSKRHFANEDNTVVLSKGAFSIKGEKLPIFTMSSNGVLYSNTPENFDTYLFDMSRSNLECQKLDLLTCSCTSKDKQRCENFAAVPEMAKRICSQLDKYDSNFHPILGAMFGTKMGILHVLQDIKTTDTPDLYLDQVPLHNYLAPVNIDIYILNNNFWVKPYGMAYSLLPKYVGFDKNHSEKKLMYVNEESGAYACDGAENINIGGKQLRKMVCNRIQKLHILDMLKVVQKYREYSFPETFKPHFKNGVMVYSPVLVSGSLWYEQMEDQFVETTLGNGV